MGPKAAVGRQGAAHRAGGRGGLWVLALAAALATAPAAAGPRRFAVVVGANVGASFQSPLRHAARDARKVAGVLQELGGLQPADVALLVREPTAQKILAALHAAEAQVKAVQAAGGEAVLIFYYSGHADTKALQLFGTELDLRTLRRELKTSTARVRLAMLDACHSGSVVRPKGGVRTRAHRFAVDEALGTRGFAILTSSSAGERSQESDELRGSFFTHYLVSGLRGGADADNDGRVTLGEAFRYAYRRTLGQTSRKTAEPQHPHFDMRMAGGRDLVLTALGQGARVAVTGRKESAQWFLWDPKREVVVGELDERPGRTASLVVPPSRLEVYRRSGSSVARGSIEVLPGERVTLTQKHLETVPVTAYLRKGERGMSVFLMAGVQTFLRDDVRTGYVGAAPYFTLGYKLDGLGIPQLDLVVDIGFTAHTQALTLADGTPYEQRLLEVQVGAGLMYRFDFGNLSLSLGPRLAYLYLKRAAQLPGGEFDQPVSTVSVGAVVGVRWRLGSLPVSMGVDARVAYVPLKIRDSGDGHEWLMETQAFGAYHF